MDKFCVRMALLWFFLSAQILFSTSIQSLHGDWTVQLDPENIGREQNWHLKKYKDKVTLPGSIQEQGYGENPSVNTPWTGDVKQDEYEKSKYDPYKTPDFFKYPFWLTQEKHYRGVAWFQKQIKIDPDQQNKLVILELERCHWETMVWVDDRYIGADSSLCTPHRYILPDNLTPGVHTLTIRVNNDLIINVGPNSHSISDHTQSNWNGITGRIRLLYLPPVYFENIRLFPDLGNNTVRIELDIINKSGKPQQGRVDFCAFSKHTDQQINGPESRRIEFSIADIKHVRFIYPMGGNPLLWDEFEPNIYEMQVTLKTVHSEYTQKLQFGMRSFTTKGTRIFINDRPTFLRGTLECAIFPKTGYPPTEPQEWERILNTAKFFGLNHIRFHSWCPPQAAFIAADRCGIYLHVEGPSWANQGASLGDGKPIDKFIYGETKRIFDEYGNHPSFCMYAYGNEPAGKNQKEFLGQFIEYWRSRDGRRIYTSAAGWPIIPQNDYHSTFDPRIQHWGEGLNSVINAQPPNTMFDYADIIASFEKPVVSHEIGQWCAYPDFDEISKYTGVLKAKNFEIFRDFLTQNDMGHQAKDFLLASGKLQTICYKADIEAALRTPGMAGFQLLDLHDFPGQGTALVGVLNPFWETKGYVTAEEYRRFCNSTVPLALMKKRTWKNSEIFEAEILIAHFGRRPINDAVIKWSVNASDDQFEKSGRFSMATIQLDNNQKAGTIRIPLEGIHNAQKFLLTVNVADIAENNWEFWVYPTDMRPQKPETIIQCTQLTSDVQNKLENGADVLLLLNGKIKQDKGAGIAVGFSPVFWNTVWTDMQAPHTLGILCDPDFPVFKDFPTEFHSNWQWWDIIKTAQAMLLEDFPSGLKPTIQLIDTWFEARKIGMMFEARIGNGKILVTSIDFQNDLQNRLAARQLYAGILRYMASENFNPDIKMSAEVIRQLSD
ncbi:hypothetical protein JW935_06835 [candidate division KSB1 bacterium]|nr:hypothetical protein [candidate division KSB1 bacterium]